MKSIVFPAEPLSETTLPALFSFSALPLSSEHDTYKTVKPRSWPWLSGKSPDKPVRCSLSSLGSSQFDFVDFDLINRIFGVSPYRPQTRTRTAVLTRTFEQEETSDAPAKLQTPLLNSLQWPASLEKAQLLGLPTFFET